MEQFNTVVNQNLGWIHEHKYVLPVLSLFLGMYAALARPKLPNFIAKLFENPVFRLVMISYIIYRGNKDPQLALMIAAAFLITMHMINKKQVERLGEMCEVESQECIQDGEVQVCQPTIIEVPCPSATTGNTENTGTTQTNQNEQTQQLGQGVQQSGTGRTA